MGPGKQLENAIRMALQNTFKECATSGQSRKMWVLGPKGTAPNDINYSFTVDEHSSGEWTLGFSANEFITYKDLEQTVQRIRSIVQNEANQGKIEPHARDLFTTHLTRERILVLGLGIPPSLPFEILAEIKENADRANNVAEANQGFELFLGDQKIELYQQGTPRDFRLYPSNDT